MTRKHFAFCAKSYIGDNKSDYGKEWHEFEKKQVEKHLNLGLDKKVLDIGCGIGRWAENIIDHCGEYIGTVFQMK